MAGLRKDVDLDGIGKMTGAKKAALFLMIMGEEFTCQVFKHMSDEEIRTVGEHMTKMHKVDPNVRLPF